MARFRKVRKKGWQGLPTPHVAEYKIEKGDHWQDASTILLCEPEYYMDHVILKFGVNALSRQMIRVQAVNAMKIRIGRAVYAPSSVRVAVLHAGDDLNNPETPKQVIYKGVRRVR